MTQILYEMFGAFYAITEVFNNENDINDYRNGQPILYGTPRREYFKCTENIYYIRLAKDEHDALLNVDLKGEYICDFTLASADSQELALNYLKSGDKAGFHPVTQAILSNDEANGLKSDTILETRAGIMSAEFRGFVPNHVFMIHPELAGSTTIETENESIEVSNFNPGNWYLTDNPEFLN